MKVTMILIVIGALRTAYKCLEKRQEELHIKGQMKKTLCREYLGTSKILLKVKEI